MSSPLFRWVVGPGGPFGLADLLRSHGLLRALADGRTFVNGQRVSIEAVRLSEGALIEVFAPRPSAAIELLYRGRGLVAVAKPAALPTEPDRSGADCVLTQLALALGVPGHELHALSRLDVGVSGVLLVATDPTGRAELLALRAQGRLQRRYVALAQGAPTPPEGEWNDALAAGGRGRQVVAGPAARAAQTRYRLVASAAALGGGPAVSLLALSPVTGRTHQLRAHSAAHGAPLLGDRKYGGPMRRTTGDGSVYALPQVMLHAAWVEWGLRGQVQRVTAEPSEAFVDTWLALGGDPMALQRALD